MKKPAQHSPTIAVIGGGCAGLAAGAALAQAGARITLFEAGRDIGGRARGLNWKGRRLDNGQHILLGAYRETLKLLRNCGVNLDTVLMSLPLQLTQHPGFNMRASRHLPAPLHILSGLIRADGLSLQDRLVALAFMAWLKTTGFRINIDLPLADYLKQKKQTGRVIALLWEPICLAALNTPLDQASTRVFLNVLRDSFAHAREDSHLLLPRIDLSALLAEPLADAIRAAGGDIRVNTAVTALHAEQHGFSITTAESRLSFSHAVIAVPPSRLPGLVADLPAMAHVSRLCDSMHYQPIYTIYLQYPEAVKLPMPMTGLQGGYAQWVFDRGLIDGQAGLIAAVISAEGSHQALTQTVLAETVASEISAAFPGLPAPLWHKVVAEKRATFACTPDLERPQQETAVKKLFLAGDYTAGDYPATIEGAVKSGLRCAQLILEQNTNDRPAH